MAPVMSQASAMARHRRFVVVQALFSSLMFAVLFLFLSRRASNVDSHGSQDDTQSEVESRRASFLRGGGSVPADITSGSDLEYEVARLEKPPRSFADMDIIYTWTNGSQPWYQDLLIQEFQRPKREVEGSRYRDNGELRYSFRSLLKNVGRFRTLYLVVFDERMVPSWLFIPEKWKKKVQIVAHRDIFPDGWKEHHLPTFNSNAIEVHLWRIKGLSEYFLYVNDDYFFSRKITIDDFFTSNGEAKAYTERHLVEAGKRYSILRNIPGQLWRSTVVHSQLLLENIHGKNNRKFMKHAPHVWRRSAWAAMTYIFREAIEQTSASRFRSYGDIDPRLLAAWYQVEEPGLFPSVVVSQEVSDKACALIMVNRNNLESVRQSLRWIFGEQPSAGPKFFCVNDNMPRTAAIASEINVWMDAMFPSRCPLERSTF